jgi:hypothetical protein
MLCVCCVIIISECTVISSTVQYSTVQYSTVQYVRPAMASTCKARECCVYHVVVLVLKTMMMMMLMTMDADDAVIEDGAGVSHWLVCVVHLDSTVTASH